MNKLVLNGIEQLEILATKSLSNTAKPDGSVMQVHILKAALINIFILTVHQVAVM